MHPNPVYHTQTPDRNLDWARDRGFGLLAVAAQDAAPMLAGEAGTMVTPARAPIPWEAASPAVAAER